MRRYLCILILLAWSLTPCAALACEAKSGTLGLSRTIEIDTSTGGIYGNLTKLHREPSLLRPKEVLLTFDDGPVPWITNSILNTLDKHCTKATFFMVGRMALAYPAAVQEVAKRGHTIATHTFSHPLNLRALRLDKATDQIERGFAAVALAAGAPPAPFFRFPGLSDSTALVSHLQDRGMAAFTVDVVSNDSFISDPRRLAAHTLREIERHNGGIVLFHDIKASTAKALPVILDALAEKGYHVVHMTAKAPSSPLPTLMADLKPKLAKVAGTAKPEPLLPFYGAIHPSRADINPDATVTGDEPEKVKVEEAAPSQDVAAERPSARIMTTTIPPPAKTQQDDAYRPPVRRSPPPVQRSEPPSQSGGNGIERFFNGLRSIFEVR